MNTIATTRFNNKTYTELSNYKTRKKIKGCIYGTPVKIKENIPLDSMVYVIEMNNDTNKIEGIGYIKNMIITHEQHKIYDDMDYNRYMYVGKKRLDSKFIVDEHSKKIIQVLEILLFKGAAHSKRGQGITQLPSWIIKNKYKYDFIDALNKVFAKYNSVLK